MKQNPDVRAMVDVKTGPRKPDHKLPLIAEDTNSTSVDLGPAFPRPNYVTPDVLPLPGFRGRGQ